MKNCIPVIVGGTGARGTGAPPHVPPIDIETLCPSKIGSPACATNLDATPMDSVIKIRMRCFIMFASLPQRRSNTRNHQLSQAANAPKFFSASPPSRIARTRFSHGVAGGLALPWAIFFRAFSPCSRAGRRQKFQPEFFRHLHPARDVRRWLRVLADGHQRADLAAEGGAHPVASSRRMQW